MSLIEATSLDKATRQEERRARREGRIIDPDEIEELAERYLADSSYKGQGSSYHSFVVYFSTLKKLKWVEFTGREEPSAFQDLYPPGPPRKYYRLTRAGRKASDDAWADPQRALYGDRRQMTSGSGDRLKPVGVSR